MEIAVISGKGGTGKSSISAALATAAEEVVLADCDVDAANLFLLFHPQIESEEVFISGHKARIVPEKCTNCGHCVAYCRFDAIALMNDQVTISAISCDGCGLCVRICPEQAVNMYPADKSRLYAGSFRNGKMIYGRLAPGEENSGKLVNMVREKAKEYALTYRMKHIILDGPPGIGCPVISTITGVDHVIVVTEPSISGLSDLTRVVKITEKFKNAMTVIINKSDIHPQMCEQIVAWCRDHGLQEPLLLPFDRLITEAMVHENSIVEYDPKNSISKKLVVFYRQLIKTKE